MLTTRDGKAFPVEFQKVLVLYSTNYTHLARQMERKGFPISKQFLFQIGAGDRSVPPLQLRRVCETLGCTAEEKKALSLAACRDLGFYV